MFPFNHATIKAMMRRKTLAEAQSSDDTSGAGLHRTLTAVDLILYGVGSSVGAGIFVLVGL
jgi:amino acid permease